MNTMGLSKIVTDYGWIVKELLNTLQVTTVVTTTGVMNGWYGNSPSNAWLMSIWMDMNMTQAWLIQAIDALMPVNSTMTMGHGWGYWWHPSNSSTQWMEMGKSLRQVGMWGTMAEMNRQEVMNIWGLYNQQHKRNLLPQQGPIHCDLSADSNIYSQDWSSHDHISTGQTLGSPKMGLPASYKRPVYLWLLATEIAAHDSCFSIYLGDSEDQDWQTFHELSGHCAADARYVAVHAVRAVGDRRWDEDCWKWMISY